MLDTAVEILSEQAAEFALSRLYQTPWQWTVLTNPAFQSTTIEDPASYTLAFAENGTLTVTADCNQAGGEYTRGEDNALTITLGPTTTAACPEGSQSETFLTYLAAATGYQFDGNNLNIILNPESGGLALTLEPTE